MINSTETVRRNTEIFNRFVKVADKRLTVVLLMILSFFEAGFFFIFPDYFLFLFGLVDPKKVKKVFLLLWIASFIGTLSFILFILTDTVMARSILNEVPFVNSWMFIRVEDLYNSIGMPALFLQPFSGIPVKVWTYEAVVGSVDLIVFSFFASIARFIRMFMTMALSKYLGERYRTKISENFMIITMIYTALFLMVLLITSG